jgi:lysyl-tRNA synthetase class 2
VATGAADWRPSADRATLVARAALFAAIREFMAQRGLLEVDTPLLARAAPSERGLRSFAVAEGGYLVPTPEHGLKRLLAAGMGPIYQLGPAFRADEAGRWHNPEFCLLEWYRPGADMPAVISETAALVTAVADAPATRQTTYQSVFVEHLGLDPLAAGASLLAATAQARGVAPPKLTGGEDRAFWLDLLMSVVVAPRLGYAAPVCVTGFPADDAVLVAPDASDPRIAQRFEFYWCGVELANGARELQDAELARRRMTREVQARISAGQPVAPIDKALLAAMEAGLPACAGVALGVDRLLALALDRDELASVLPFAWPRR